MSGNMQELVNDIYDSEAYDNHASDNVAEPSVGELAVRRGGTWWGMTR
jgi:formylglycine-generating enzyme required for sulfatase activity